MCEARPRFSDVIYFAFHCAWSSCSILHPWRAHGPPQALIGSACPDSPPTPCYLRWLAKAHAAPVGAFKAKAGWGNLGRVGTLACHESPKKETRPHGAVSFLTKKSCLCYYSWSSYYSRSG